MDTFDYIPSKVKFKVNILQEWMNGLFPPNTAPTIETYVTTALLVYHIIEKEIYLHIDFISKLTSEWCQGCTLVSNKGYFLVKTATSGSFLTHKCPFSCN